MIIFENLGLNMGLGGILGAMLGGALGYIVGRRSDKKQEKNEQTPIYTQKELDDEWFATTHIDCARYLTDEEFERLQGLHQKVKLLKEMKK